MPNKSDVVLVQYDDENWEPDLWFLPRNTSFSTKTGSCIRILASGITHEEFNRMVKNGDILLPPTPERYGDEWK